MAAPSTRSAAATGPAAKAARSRLSAPPGSPRTAMAKAAAAGCRPRLAGAAAAGQGRARPRPGLRRIAVGRIVDPPLASRRQLRAQRRPPHAEQRPQQEHPPPLGPHRRGRPFAQGPEVGAPGAHQLGLEDVVGGVAEHHDPGPGVAGGLGEQPVAGGAGGGGQAGRRLVALPGQGAESDPQPGGGLGGEGGPGGAGASAGRGRRSARSAAARNDRPRPWPPAAPPASRRHRRSRPPPARPGRDQAAARTHRRPRARQPIIARRPPSAGGVGASLGRGTGVRIVPLQFGQGAAGVPGLVQLGQGQRQLDHGVGGPGRLRPAVQGARDRPRRRRRSLPGCIWSRRSSSGPERRRRCRRSGRHSPGRRRRRTDSRRRAATGGRGRRPPWDRGRRRAAPMSGRRGRRRPGPRPSRRAAAAAGSGPRPAVPAWPAVRPGRRPRPWPPRPRDGPGPGRAAGSRTGR